MIKYFTISVLISIVFMDYVGVSMSATLFPSLILNRNTSIISYLYSDHMRLNILCFLLAMYPLGQFFGATLFGKMSDSKGRKSILLVTLAGTLIGMMISAFSIINSSIVMLFIGRLTAGFFAGNVAVAQASMLDISKENEKSSNIGLVQATMGIGWIVGPVLTALLSLKDLGTILPKLSVPFVFVSLVLVAIIFATLFFFKETNYNKVKNKINLWEQFNGIKSAFMEIKLRYALVIYSLFAMGWMFFEQYLPTSFQYNFAYNTQEMSIFLASLGFVYAVSNLLVGKRVNKKFQAKNILKYSCVVSGLSLILAGLAPNHLLTLIFTYIWDFSCVFTIPSLIVYVTKNADPKQQGQILGVISSVQALATIVTSLFGGHLINMNPKSAMFFGAGLFVLLAWALFMVINYLKRKEFSKILDGRI